MAQLVLCIRIALKLLPRRIGIAGDKKKQFNRSGFVQTARAPTDCIQIQLDECVQIKYLGTRHMGQST